MIQTILRKNIYRINFIITDCCLKTKLHESAIPTLLTYENVKGQLAATLGCKKKKFKIRSEIREGIILRQNLVS